MFHIVHRSAQFYKGTLLNKLYNPIRAPHKHQNSYNAAHISQFNDVE